MKSRTNNRDDAAPKIYRSDLIWNAFKDRGEDYRNKAAAIGIAVNTLRDVIDGNCTKLDTLWKVARHFKIEWLELFNVERRQIGDTTQLTLAAARGGSISVELNGTHKKTIEPGKSLGFAGGKITVRQNKGK